MARTIREFERPIIELEDEIEELKRARDPRYEPRIELLHEKLEKLYEETFSNLTAWQRVELARHPDRPYMLDYVSQLMTDFIELRGDRLFRDDPAIVVGLARFKGHKVVVIGQQKGRDVKARIHRNFGMAHPEGYRKALRAVRLAEKFRRPVISIVDTPAAYPGIGAEERGQAEAIARNIYVMSRLRTPIVVVVTGEGGSGGALGIGVGDRVMMQENAIYSVIPPEGCAAILFRDGKRGAEAAEALKITAAELLSLKIIDEVIPEPRGGAHRDPVAAASLLSKMIERNLKAVCSLSLDDLLRARHDKFRNMGVFLESGGEKSS